MSGPAGNRAMEPYDGPDEYPITAIPDIAAWSENYAAEIACRETGIAIFYSSGRLPLDPTVWRELIMLQAPDGQNFFQGVWPGAECQGGWGRPDRL